jgi:hypothetical protein
VSAHHLSDRAHAIECDVLVCGDGVAARQTVIRLDLRYKVPGSGFRITGIPDHRSV